MDMLGENFAVLLLGNGGIYLFQFGSHLLGDMILLGTGMPLPGFIGHVAVLCFTRQRIQQNTWWRWQ